MSAIKLAYILHNTAGDYHSMNTFLQKQTKKKLADFAVNLNSVVEEFISVEGMSKFIAEKYLEECGQKVGPATSFFKTGEFLYYGRQLKLKELLTEIFREKKAVIYGVTMINRSVKYFCAV